MSKDGTAALLSSTVDDISQGIDSVDISNDDGITAAAACDMINSSREEDMYSEKKFTSCDQKLEHTKSNGISHNSASIQADNDVVSRDIGSGVDVSLCANCGKEGAANTCNKFKMVKYCNAVCKKRHRSKHKKDCEEHLKHMAAALQEEEIKRAAELHDVELFKQPPQKEDDCPICFQLLPLLGSGKRYQSCCGKVICSGCIYAMDNKLCPFCRTPTPDSEGEVTKRLHKRMEVGDTEAIRTLGDFYYGGTRGFAQDYTKALELWHHAAELGHVNSYYSIGNAYYYGRGVERDKKKAIHYFEIGSMKGDTVARHSLGALEQNAGNIERALKHYMITVESGEQDSLKAIQDLYPKGKATKDEYVKALRAYQKYLNEVKSIQRDEASAYNELYKYI